MAKQILMSSGSEEGLEKLLKSYYYSPDAFLVGSDWPKGVSNGVRVLEDLRAVKKGRKHVRYQIVRVLP